MADGRMVRPIRPDEHVRLGAATLSAYHAILPDHIHEPDYDAVLIDIPARLAADCEVVVAIEEGAVVGGVTYVPDAANPFAEFDDVAAASFRHLAVDPVHAGRGAGRALVEWCIARARRDGRARLIIHSTPWMEAAHRLYQRLGFERRPDLDFTPVPDVPLRAFVLEL